MRELWPLNPTMPPYDSRNRDPRCAGMNVTDARHLGEAGRTHPVGSRPPVAFLTYAQGRAVSVGLSVGSCMLSRQAAGLFVDSFEMRSGVCVLSRSRLALVAAQIR